MISVEETALMKCLSQLPEPQACGEYSLSNGAALFALCAHAVSKRGNANSARLKARAYFERAVALLNDSENTSSLFRGITGVGFVASVMGHDDYEELLGEIDDVLLEGLSTSDALNIDIVHGLSGIMIYGLQRESQGKTGVINASTALASSWLRAWLNDDQALVGSKHARNLGVAHGVPGLLLMMCNAAHFGKQGYVDLSMLASCVARIARSQLTGNFGPTYPYAEGGKEPGRLAWCYGDLGILLLFHAYWRLTGQDMGCLEELAGSIARRGVSDPSLRDASLCHGFSGLALILRHVEDEACFSNETSAQLRQIRVAASKRSAALAAGAAVETYVNGRFLRSTSLLEGGCGVALALDNLECGDAVPWKSLLGIF
ncbi:lanthionine synthetase LanC family protein [Stenotrophomonas hibiscicola]|uniref:lanthionine synthetase LanC family protein n=1 Tax=Stenotrophomonas hibiscicola TaxID=86189 RepID=UPI002E77D3AC|nr:lanthionine synthetase LanC family protein [[Pseudomonas] hibiscicola]